MNNVFIVARRELATRLRQPSFYVASLVMPLLLVAIGFGLSVANANTLNETVGNVPGSVARAPAKPSGYVDQAGVVRTMPLEVHAFFIPYTDETDAAAALRDGAITAYFVIPPNYLATGRVVRVSTQVSPFGGEGADTQALQTLLRANLANDAALAQRLNRLVDLRVDQVGAPAQAVHGRGDGVSFSITAYALAFVLAFAIINGGAWLVQAVVEEKENRTIEVVLTSLRPTQLMAGKLLGLGSVALIQLAIWATMGGGVFAVGAAVGASVLGLVPWSAWVWLLVYFLLGFSFYGAIMMSIGAMGATIRESQQVSGLMTLPMFLPLWFGVAVVESPNGIVAQVLSYIPFTAPVTMMLRLAQTTVPLWQILVSVVVLAAAVVGAVWLAARVFRASTLLTGTKPSLRTLIRIVRAA